MMQHQLQDPSKPAHAIISPTVSAGGTSAAGSVGINSNVTMSSTGVSPGAKESIASRSDASYPMIECRSGFWDTRRNQKLLRFVTVIAYIFFVSLAAIVLSMYYYFFHVPNMGFTVEESFKLKPDASVIAVPMETFVGRGRKRVSLQHNVNHFPLEATSIEITTLSSSDPSLPKCDTEQTTGTGMETKADDRQDFDEDGPPVRDGGPFNPQALPLNSRPVGVPTMPSLYEMIARRSRQQLIQRQSATDTREYERMRNQSHDA